MDLLRTFWDATDSGIDCVYVLFSLRLGTKRNIIVRRKLLRLKVVIGSNNILEINTIARTKPPILPRESRISYVDRLIVSTLGSKYKSILENLYLPFGSIDG